MQKWISFFAQVMQTLPFLSIYVENNPLFALPGEHNMVPYIFARL